MMQGHLRPRRAILAAALAATSVVGASMVTPAGAATAGPTIKITVVDSNSPAQPQPEILNGAKAAAEAITKSGTAKIDIDVCEGPTVVSADPNAILPCVHQAIDNKSSAFIGNPGDDGMALLTTAQIPVFTNTPISPTEYTSPLSFVPTGGGPTGFGGQGAALVSQGAKKVALLDFDIDAAKPLANFAKEAVKGAGGKIVGEFHVPFQAVDVSSQVQQFKQSGADGAVIITTEDIAAMLIRTLNQFGVKALVSYPAIGFRKETLDSLGDLSKGILSGNSVPLLSLNGKTPANAAQFVKELKAAKLYDADNLRGTSTWLAVHAMAEVAKDQKGTLDGPALYSALQKSPGIELPIVGHWVPSANGPFAKYARLSNGTTFFQQYNGKTWVNVKPFAGVDIFKIMTKGGATADG